MRRRVTAAIASALMLAPGAGFAAEDGVSLQHAHEPLLFHKIVTEIDVAPLDDLAVSWDVDGWVGGDIERLWLRSEGERVEGALEEADVELFYGWNVAEFWDALIGLRHDFEPTTETYLAASVVGLMPYFFETEASLYVSSEGDVSLRIEQGFDLLITQHLIAEPHIEAELFAQDVPERHVGAGLSSIEASLQLRYEITRKFAPFAEIEWSRKIGETSARAQAEGEDVDEATLRLGLRFWF